MRAEAVCVAVGDAASTDWVHLPDGEAQRAHIEHAHHVPLAAGCAAGLNGFAEFERDEFGSLVFFQRGTRGV